MLRRMRCIEVGRVESLQSSQVAMSLVERGLQYWQSDRNFRIVDGLPQGLFRGINLQMSR